MKKLFPLILLLFYVNSYAQVTNSIILTLDYSKAPFKIEKTNSGIYGISNFDIEKNSVALYEFNDYVKHVYSENKLIQTVKLDKASFKKTKSAYTNYLEGKNVYSANQVFEEAEVTGFYKNESGESVSVSVSENITLNVSNNYSKSTNSFSYDFPGDLAFAELVGIDSEDYLYILVERYLQQVPLRVKREVYTFNKSGNVQSVLELPDIKYLFTISDLQIDTEGNLYHLLSEKDGVKVFKWTGLKNESTKTITYPEEYNYHLHFNELLPTDEIETVPVPNKITSSSRTMALRIGEAYAYHTYTCASNNLAPYEVTAPDGDVVVTPSRLIVGENGRIPYKWGGFNTLSQFDAGLLAGKYAGDIHTSGVSSYAVGVDCSGFVSRCWQMSYHASTGYMPGITGQYSSWNNIKPGDAHLKQGHVRLHVSIQPNGRLKTVESTSARGWGVTYYDFAPSDITNYNPVYYNSMVSNYFDNQPKLLSVLKTSDNKVNLVWECDETDVAHYKIYRAPDRTNWTMIATTLDTTYTDDLPSSMAYYRISSVKNDSENSESDLSNELGIGILTTGKKYLVVDGFDRESGSWRGAGHKFAARYGNSIFKNNISFESIKSRYIETSGISLNDFDAVIWMAGDESTVLETFSSIEQEAVSAFLENGGSLFVSGSEIGWDLDSKGSDKDQQFYNNYLKADYVSDDANVLKAIGEEGTSLAGCTFYFGQTYIEDYPDVISAYGGSTVCMMYSNNKAAGIEYAGNFGSSTTPGKIIYLAFPLETTANDVAFDQVLSKAVDYFNASITSVNLNDNIVTEYSLAQNYPNPFNPSTKIKFTIPAGNEHFRSVLKVYDILGNEIATLVDEQKSPGTHEVVFNASNLASGMYFYKFQSGSFSETRKMMLLK